MDNTLDVVSAGFNRYTVVAVVIVRTANTKPHRRH